VKIAFIDESGSPSPNDRRRFLAITALVVDSPRPIELAVRQARRLLRLRSPQSELKASNSQPKVIKPILLKLAQIPFRAYTVIVDKISMDKESAESVYRLAMAKTIWHCARDFPQLHVIIDKRFTIQQQRTELETAIRQMMIPVSNQLILISQENSMDHPGLQAVDFIAWATMQKYEYGQNWAADILAPHVVVEELISGKKIAALPGGR